MFLQECLVFFYDADASINTLTTKLVSIKLPTPKREWAIQLFLFLFLEQLILLPLNGSDEPLGLCCRGLN